MFSFHKPKIYRSLKGCCICRAKSSSSRFTDSKRYEPDFEKCFKTCERRAGEICNACVLLVKRWKKLPAGSNRNWHHVVDARAGPGTKSIMKMKSNKIREEKQIKKKHKHKKIRPNRPPQSPSGLSDDIVLGDDCHSDRSSHSINSSPIGSDCSDDEGIHRKERTLRKNRRKKSTPVRFSSFLDLTYWKKTEVCCGIIFKGASGEVLIDQRFWRPCTCKPSSAPPSPPSSHSSESQDTLHDQQTDIDTSQEPELDHNLALLQEHDLNSRPSLDSGSAKGQVLSMEISADSPSQADSSSRMERASPFAGLSVQASSSVAAAAAAVLDLSLPHRKTPVIRPSPVLPGPRCIEMEV